MRSVHIYIYREREREKRDTGIHARMHTCMHACGMYTCVHARTWKIDVGHRNTEQQRHSEN